MNKLFSILLLTVMLRIYWNDYTYFGDSVKAGSGVYFGISMPWFYVRTDDGAIISIYNKSIYKTKWVDVKPEGSNE